MSRRTSSGVIAVVAIALVGLLAPSSATASAGDPRCGKGTKELARSGAVRLVLARDGRTVSVCSRSLRRPVFVVREQIVEMACGSNSDAGGTTAGPMRVAGRYAVVAVQTTDVPDCGDDSFGLVRVDLRRGTRSVVAERAIPVYGELAFRVNSDGAVVYEATTGVHEARTVRIATVGSAPRLLLADNAGSWTGPRIVGLHAGRVPAVTVRQGDATTRIDTARHLRALSRCGGTSRALVTATAAAGGSRLCDLRSGRSFGVRACRLVRGAVALCDRRLVELASGRTALEHPRLADLRPRVRDDVVGAPGGRAVALVASAAGPDRVVILGPDGSETELASTPTGSFERLRITGTTVRWVRRAGRTTEMSAPLP
jgi:hypothetical protein